MAACMAVRNACQRSKSRRHIDDVKEEEVGEAYFHSFHQFCLRHRLFLYNNKKKWKRYIRDLD